MSRWKKYRIVLICILAGLIIFACTYYYISIKSLLPDTLKVVAGKEMNFDLKLPVEARFCCKEKNDAKSVSINNMNAEENNNIHFSMSTPFTVNAYKTGNYNLKVKLFGLISLKDVSISAVEDEELVPCGNTIGLYIKTNGLLVLGTGSILCQDGSKKEPAYEIIQSGDYINKVDGRKADSIKELQNIVQNTKKDKIKVQIIRKGYKSSVSLSVITGEDGVKKLGIWVREDTQGIGTLTFVRSDGRFGALGHGITDVDTGELMSVKDGGIYNSEVVSIIKGRSGTPGEMMGMIMKSKEQMLGSIQENTRFGIRGKVNDDKMALFASKKAVPIGFKQEIEKGPAYILCQTDGVIKEYSVEIEKIRLGSKDNKGIVLKVTDSGLLNKTGGIIQGMSGSPILQNGHIIGAVTHVFVNEPERGYGIFIEEMLEK